MLNTKHTTPPVLEIIGRYITIDKKLGEGACGQVFLANTKLGIACTINAGETEIRFPVKFVVKVMNAQMYTPHLIKHVYNEILSLQKLNHECVVGYLASWIEKGKGKFRHSYCLAMKYCNGGDLHNLITDHIRRKQFIAESLVLHVMRDVFSALQFMHEKKIIHRDIKPANVLLEIDKFNSVLEHALIGDYGLSRPIQDSRELVKSRVGTLFYCSPQIVRGTPYSSKTDIFSAGVMFFEMMCLRRPFGELHDEHQMVFYDIIHKDPQPLFYQITKGCYSRALLQVVTACLAKHESCRPSALEVLSLLYNQSPFVTTGCSLIRQATPPPPPPPPQPLPQEIPILIRKKEEKMALLQSNGERHDIDAKEHVNQHEKLEIKCLNNINQNRKYNQNDCNSCNHREAVDNNIKVNDSNSSNDYTKPFDKKNCECETKEAVPQICLRESAEHATAAEHNDDAVNKTTRKSPSNTCKSYDDINKNVLNNNTHNASLNKHCKLATNERDAKIAPMRPSILIRTKFHRQQSTNKAKHTVTHWNDQNNNENNCESVNSSKESATPRPELLYCEQKCTQKPSCNFNITSTTSSSIIEKVFSELYNETNSSISDQSLLGLVNNDKVKYIVLKIIAAAYVENSEQLLIKVNGVNALFQIRNDTANEIVKLIQKSLCRSK